MATIDLYCERIGAGLGAEPVNAATNAAFLVAAWLIWRHARRSAGLTLEAWVLLGLLVSIGLGSALFHTLATGLTRALDAGAIAAFILAFLWIYGRAVAGLSRLAAALLPAAYVTASLAGRQFPQFLNGSLIYAPALFFVLGLGFVHLIRAKAARHGLISAAGVFALSMTFRGIDNALCDVWPLGTHFLWHVSNSIALCIATRTLLANLTSHAAADSSPRLKTAP